METCLTMCLNITAKCKNWTKSKCPSIGEWVTCGLIIQWNVVDSSYNAWTCNMCIKFLKIILSKKKASLQSDTYSMTSFIKAFKLAKRYNKMISDMNIYSKSIGECILSKNTNDYH